MSACYDIIYLETAELRFVQSTNKLFMDSQSLSVLVVRYRTSSRKVDGDDDMMFWKLYVALDQVKSCETSSCISLFLPLKYNNFKIEIYFLIYFLFCV